MMPVTILKRGLASVRLPQCAVLREWRAVALTIGLAALIAILYSVAWLTFAVLVVTVFLLRWTLVKVRATARLIAWLPISVYDFVAKWLE